MNSELDVIFKIMEVLFILRLLLSFLFSLYVIIMYLHQLKKETTAPKVPELYIVLYIN